MTLARLLLLALLVLLAAHTAPAQAQAAGSIRYFSSGGERPTYTPQYIQEMSLSLLLEARAADGRLLCSPCTAVPAGAATYSATVEGWNAQRYEVISETCKGVRSTVPQFQCTNGPLELNVRVRTGEVELRTAYLPGTSTTPYGAWVNGPRLVFLENPNKYWDLVLPDGKIPAGKYKIANGNQTGVLPRGGSIVGCNKTHVNTEDTLDVPAGGSVIHTMVFRIDDCPVRVEVDISTIGTQTYEIQGATLTCRRAFTSLDYCEGWIQHGTDLTITARVPDGFQPRFRGRLGCSAVNACTFKVQTHEVVRMSIEPSVAPPPPTASLSVSLGDAPPLSRTEAKGSNSVPWLQARLAPADGTVEVTALTLQASGTGRDDLDLTQLRVHVDSNANGRVDAGEPMLGSGRFTSDNGNLTLTLASPLAVAAPMHLLVVGDVASTVNTAAALGLGGTALAMLGLLVWPGARRRGGHAEPESDDTLGSAEQARRRGRLASVAVGLLMLAACGGGDGADPAPASPAPPPAPAPPPVSPPPPPPPPPPAVSYEIRLTAVQARSAATPATTVSASGLPIPGATISVQP
ncbi:MAG: hypothetical protein ACKVQR_05180 [Aquabacterium sp.]